MSLDDRNKDYLACILVLIVKAYYDQIYKFVSAAMCNQW